MNRNQLSYFLLFAATLLPGHAFASLNAVDEISIIGGTEVQQGDPVLKSTVAIFDGSALCTGSIIDQDLVVTAAHCISDPSRMAVLFTTDLEANEGSYAQLIGA